MECLLKNLVAILAALLEESENAFFLVRLTNKKKEKEVAFLFEKKKKLKTKNKSKKL